MGRVSFGGAYRPMAEVRALLDELVRGRVEEETEPEQPEVGEAGECQEPEAE